MSLTESFFTVVQAVLWCLLGLPFIVLSAITIGFGIGLVEQVSVWLGLAIYLTGWLAMVELSRWMYRTRRRIITLALRLAAFFYGLVAYLAEAGMRSYEIVLIEGRTEVRYRFPSLRLIAACDPETIPLTLWEISVESR